MSDLFLNPTERGSTEWAAMRYALGELDDMERERFEEELAVDQVARDCLVEAVGVLDACGATESSATSSPTTAKRAFLAARRRNSRKWLAIAGTVASLLIVLGIWSAVPNPWPGDGAPTASSSSPEAVEIVSRWTASSTASAEDEFPLAGDSARDSVAELLPPDWLLAAVAHEQLAAPATLPFEDDPTRVERN